MIRQERLFRLLLQETVIGSGTEAEETQESKEPRRLQARRQEGRRQEHDRTLERVRAKPCPSVRCERGGLSPCQQGGWVVHIAHAAGRSCRRARQASAFGAMNSTNMIP